MERLTEKFDDGEVFCGKIGAVEDVGIDETIFVGELVDKLAEYEQAEEDGLLKRVAIGKWIFKNDGAYGKRRAYCSVCGKRSGIGGIESNQRKPYCPNCGANMKGE